MITIDPIERQLFLEGILRRYGYDFREYSDSSIDRCMQRLMIRFNTDSLMDVLKEVLRSSESFKSILPILTVHTTEFFRDPAFFKSIRENVFPVLKTYPKIVIWVAGCSTGQEVLSLAIALKEEGLHHRTIIHATDINPNVIHVAKEGIYDATSIELFNKNYVAAGGSCSPSDYYTTEYGLVRFDRELLSNVVFSDHNLATDDVFVEAHLIVCRNVLIYFSKDLQNKIFHLFARSLVFKGFLALGPKETLKFSSVESFFDIKDADSKIYSMRLRDVPNFGIKKKTQDDFMDEESYR